MPKVYQSTKNNPYWLRKDVYMQIIYAVKGYSGQKTDYEEILRESPNPPKWEDTPYGLSRGSGVTDRTQARALRRIAFGEEFLRLDNAIKHAMSRTPEEYRAWIMRNICSHCKYPEGTDKKMYRCQKQRFIYLVAAKLNLVVGDWEE